MMMYEELLYKEYFELLYDSFLTTLVLHKQMPEKVIRFENMRNKVTFDVFKRGANGYMTTKKLCCKSKDAIHIESWLRRDFPDVDIIPMCSEDKEETI